MTPQCCSISDITAEALYPIMVHGGNVGDIAVAAGVAFLVLIIGGIISLRTVKKVGLILTAAVALVTFLTLLGL